MRRPNSFNSPRSWVAIAVRDVISCDRMCSAELKLRSPKRWRAWCRGSGEHGGFAYEPGQGRGGGWGGTIPVWSSCGLAFATASPLILNSAGSICQTMPGYDLDFQSIRPLTAVEPCCIPPILPRAGLAYSLCLARLTAKGLGNFWRWAHWQAFYFLSGRRIILTILYIRNDRVDGSECWDGDLASARELAERAIQADRSLRITILDEHGTNVCDYPAVIRRSPIQSR